MVLTTDMKWSKSKVPDSAKIKDVTKTKRIIFIRHGQSLWNEAFNGSKMPHLFLYRTVMALVGEILLLPAFDSVLFDSPLTNKGFVEAKQLARTIKNYPKARHDASEVLDRDVAALRGEGDRVSSVVISSNLRRAAQTAVVGLWPRFKPEQKGGPFCDQIKIISHLQEISRNVDTLSLTKAHEAVPLPRMENHCGTSVDGAQLFELQENNGNKPIFGTGLKRLQAFCVWAHAQEEDVIICAGHSLWFKHFFKTYLPKKTEHDAKDCKMHNGAAVAFDLQCGTDAANSAMFRVEPSSITVIDEQGGFDNKIKKKKMAAKASKKRR